MKFGSHPHDALMRETLMDAGCDSAGVIALVNTGLTWPQILGLGFKYGQTLFQLGTELLSLIQANNLSSASIQMLVSKYGPQVEAMIREILGMIGLKYPA